MRDSLFLTRNTKSAKCWDILRTLKHTRDWTGVMFTWSTWGKLTLTRLTWCRVSGLPCPDAGKCCGGDGWAFWTSDSEPASVVMASYTEMSQGYIQAGHFTIGLDWILQWNEQCGSLTTFTFIFSLMFTLRCIFKSSGSAVVHKLLMSWNTFRLRPRSLERVLR